MFILSEEPSALVNEKVPADFAPEIQMDAYGANGSWM